MRMLRIILPSVFCSAVQYFSHSISWTARFSGGGGGLLNTKCVLIFSTTLSETLLTLRGIQRNINKNLHVPTHKTFVILARVQWDFIILNRFVKKHSNIRFYETRAVGADFLDAYGGTDRWTDRQTEKMQRIIVLVINSRFSQKCGKRLLMKNNVISSSPSSSVNTADETLGNKR